MPVRVGRGSPARLHRVGRHSAASPNPGSRAAGHGLTEPLDMGRVSSPRADPPLVPRAGRCDGEVGPLRRATWQSDGRRWGRWRSPWAEVLGCTRDVVRAWRCPAHESADDPALAAEPAHRHEERASALLDALLRDGVTGHQGVRVRRATVEGAAHGILVNRAAAAGGGGRAAVGVNVVPADPQGE